MAPPLDLQLLFKRIQHSGGLLTESQRETLRNSFERVRHVEARTDILKEDDRPTTSTLLLSGFAMRYRQTSNGNRQITSIHLPGDFVDLHTFPLRNMDHSVGALTPCEVATMPHETLRQIIRSDPDLMEILWRLSLLDGAVHREWLVAMGALPAVSHMAHLLCEVYIRLADVGLAKDLAFDLPVTQLDLGHTLGLSAVHVNRVLQELRGNKVVRYEGKRVTILDWDRLVQIGDFDDKYLHLTVKVAPPTGISEGKQNAALLL